MKKIFTLLLALMLGAASFSFAGCGPRENRLKIYTWEYYIDEKYVKKEFPKFYAEKTGGIKVKVQINGFDTNEDMYYEISEKKKDYDLACPSDYMVERMKSEDLLLEIDMTGYKSLLDESILSKLEIFDEDHKYAFPYAWGTFGIMYNAERVAAGDEKSWSTMWNEAPSGTSYNNKIYMKDSEREAFAAANLYLNKTDLLAAKNQHGYASDEYQILLESMFYEEGAAFNKMLTDAEAALKEQKKVIYAYESEQGKTVMGNNGSEANLGLFWSCDAGLVMPDNQKLRYYIPDEGSNFYVDCFVIPKYAENTEAAELFLEFLTIEKTAYNNMIESGATGAVVSANKKYAAELEKEDWPTEFKRNYIDMVMFPSEETLLRCTVMRDYGETNNDAIAKMFFDVKKS